ncbi:MAG: hypothetical protein ACK55I_08810, partial [bacterium]
VSPADNGFSETIERIESWLREHFTHPPQRTEQEQPLPPVEIGVDVTADGASVVAFYRRPKMINLKTNIMCKICRKVLKDPVNLPCECVACLEHIAEITKDSNNNQNNQMMCP